MKKIMRIVPAIGFVTTLLLGRELTSIEIEKRVDEILSRMSFAEKIGQMTQYSGINGDYEERIRKGAVGSLLNVTGAEETNRIQKIAVEESRLGIPLILGLDVIHGYRTIFPIPLANAASWDTALIRQASAIAAKEAAAAGLHWTFAPMVDIARDPRWGRIAEGAGEDPFLGAAIAQAQVCGFQGKDLSHPLTLLACAKHYVGYGEAEGGRDYNTTDFSERTLREIYLPPFKAAADAGAGSFMSAFNDLGGVPASANYLTLRHILKNEWGFGGFVVSDWNSIGELVSHGIAADRNAAGIKAIRAGVDMDMEGRCFTTALRDAIDSRELSMDLIDDAVRRILRMKYRLGLFDHPYIDETLQEESIRHPEHVQTALELARESIVLLKNDKQVLPLNEEKIERLAIIGPLADDSDAPLGTWRCQGRPENVVSIYQGLKNKFEDGIQILYTKGCNVNDSNRRGFKKALSMARKSDVIIMVMGESADMSGEAASRSNLNLPGVQTELVETVAQTGKPIVLVLVNGRPLTLAEIEPDVTAIVESWHLGDQHGKAVAEVLGGDYNPEGKLTTSFPRSVGQIPIYYNHKNSGRPGIKGDKFTSKYIDLPLTPLYPFGYGLSYTTYRYTDLKIRARQIKATGSLVATVRVKNTGRYDGVEIVQLYVHDLVSSVTRPVMELKGFKRIELKAGEQRTVEFEIPAGELGCYNLEMEYVVEPGEYELMIGGSSAHTIKDRFQIVN